MNSIADIKHVYYINLDTRPDRKAHVENQLRSIGLGPVTTRFKAIRLANGAIGCSMSHLKLLEMAKENNLPHILIVEDDILFTNVSLFVKQMNSFLRVHKDFDVALIAGNNMPPYQRIDRTCVRVAQCQTTTGYLVQQHYYDTIIQNVKQGIEHLMREPHNHSLYAIDKYWFQLQRTGHWYLIIPLSVTQREDYSDIEKREINYTPAMLDLDKNGYFQSQRDQIVKANLGNFDWK